MKNSTAYIMLSCFLMMSFSIAQAQQNNTFINSGELLKKGNELHDKKQYKEAIDLYRQINRSDTNYATALYELSLTNYADSQLQAAQQYALEGLQLFPEQFPKFSMQLASVLDDMNKPAEALKIYDEALKKDPQSNLLYFNKAISQIRSGNDADAKLNLQQSLLINPYYSSAHFFLGSIYLRSGNLIPVILAYKTYLLLSPSGKYAEKCLGILAAIAKVTDEVRELSKIKNTSGEDNFDFLQQIVLSKIALDNQYKSKVKLEDNIIKQIQVVDEKLEYKSNDKGFAMQFYVPLYAKLFKEDDFEAMIYSIFSGLNINEVDSWRKKNTKSLDAMALKAAEYLNEIKYTRVMKASERKDAAVRYYYEAGQYLGRGPFQLANKQRNMTGNWEFYHDNGVVKAKGTFDNQALKEGEWIYYYNTGEIKEKTTYIKGVANGYSESRFINGNKSYSLTFKDGKINGVVSKYFYNGILLSTSMYSDDKKNGEEQEYTSTGHRLFIAHYINDIKEGLVTYYYPNGNKQDELLYTKGKATGTYKSYYKDGKLMTQGEFEDNMKKGLWTSFYNSGSVKEKSVYDNNEITGEFTEYFESGKLDTKGNYTKKKLDGKIEYFTEEGALHSDAVYDRGKLREITFYDSKGKIVSANSLRKGAGDIVFYSSDGIKTSQGSFTKEGNKDGEYIEYFSSGKVSDKVSYQDGVKQGLHTGWFSNGKISGTNYYTAGKENGNTKEYFTNGKLRYDGWIIDDQKQQRSVFYNQFGDVRIKEYYLDNELNGYDEYFYPGNIKDCDYKYFNGWLEGSVQFDSTGKVLVQNTLYKGSGPFIFKHQNGKNYIECTYANYLLNGIYNALYFDGSPMITCYYRNGRQDSIYKSYYYGGQLKMQGRYSYDGKEGVWKYFYPNGKLSEEEMYKEGKLDGPDIFYNEDGTKDRIGNYKEGQLEGEYRYFGENMQTALVLNYYRGNIKSYSYEDKSGVLIPAVALKGGTGIIKSFYKSGATSAEFTFIDYNIEGPRKFFYSTGKLLSDGIKISGYDEGVKRQYYESGQVKTDEKFTGGNRHGICIKYYPTGKKESEENFYNDQLHGISKYFDEAGKLKQTRHYYYDNLLSVDK